MLIKYSFIVSNKYRSVIVAMNRNFSNAKILLTILSLIGCLDLKAQSGDSDIVTPPKDAKIETWDWYYSYILPNFSNWNFKLDVALSEDSIYFRLADRGQSQYESEFDGPFYTDSWVRGKIQGDKVVINRPAKLMSYRGMEGDDGPDHSKFAGYKYFNASKFWTENTYHTDQHYYMSYNVETIDKDITFDYNPNLKILNNPDCDIWVSSYQKDEAGYESYDTPFLPCSPIYSDFELIYVPDGPLTPKAPEFLYESSCPTDRKNNKYLILNGSILSEEGLAMHYSELYYRIYVDGKPYIYDYTLNGDPITDINMGYKGRQSRNGNHLWLTHIPCDKPLSNAYAVMVYKYADGMETVSAPTQLRDVSKINELVSEDQEDMTSPVYDLSGRCVKPENLSPGIYISKGKKFIVK